MRKHSIDIGGNMATFKDYLTTEGKALVTRMLAGECTIHFKKIVFGDGYMPAGTEARNITDMVSPKCESEAAAGCKGSVVTVTGTFTNKEFTEAMYLREKGIYASDGTGEDILMLYANNGDMAEYIQPGVSALIEKVVKTVLQFAQDDIVSIAVSSGIYVTVEDYHTDQKVLIENINNKMESFTEIIKELKEYECKIAPRYVTDIEIESEDQAVVIKWKDPGETFIDGVRIALWDGTKLVYNDDHYPQTPEDGTLVVDNTVKNQYSFDGITVDNLVNRRNYFFRFFPYCVCGGVNDYSDENKVVGTPGLIPTYPVTDISATQNDASIVLKWTDPEVKSDRQVTWAKTVLVYKTGSFPTDTTDGTVVESTVNNQYQVTGLAIKGIKSGVMYYFSFFPVSTDGVVNMDESQRVSFMAQTEIGTVTNISAKQSGSNIILTWTDPEDSTATGVKWGKTVVVYKTSSYPTSITDGSVVTETTRNQYKSSGLTISGIASGKTYYFALFPVATNGTVNTSTSQRASVTPKFAIVNVSTTDSELYGKKVTATIGSNVVSGTFSSNGQCSLAIPWTGTAKINCEQTLGLADTTVTISSMTTYSAIIKLLKIVTWANGTWGEISAMLSAHYSGRINVSAYWAVGDKRSVTLNATDITKRGVNDPDYPGDSGISTLPAKNTYLIILGFDHDDLTTQIGVRKKAAVTIGIPSIGKLPYEPVDEGHSYSGVVYPLSCIARLLDNRIYTKRIPSELQALCKNTTIKYTYDGASTGTSVKKITSSYGNAKIALLSASEIVGTDNVYLTLGNTMGAVNFDDGVQYEYFKKYRFSQFGGGVSNYYSCTRSVFWSGREVSMVVAYYKNSYSTRDVVYHGKSNVYTYPWEQAVKLCL